MTERNQAYRDVVGQVTLKGVDGLDYTKVMKKKKKIFGEFPPGNKTELMQETFNWAWGEINERLLPVLDSNRDSQLAETILSLANRMWGFFDDASFKDVFIFAIGFDSRQELGGQADEEEPPLGKGYISFEREEFLRMFSDICHEAALSEDVSSPHELAESLISYLKHIPISWLMWEDKGKIPSEEDAVKGVIKILKEYGVEI